MSFPVIGLFTGKAFRIYLTEQFRGFEHEGDFRRLRGRDLKALVGMLLVDNDGGAWVVRDLRSVRLRTPWWQRILIQREDIEHEVEFVLEGRPPVPFTEVQDRVCRCIDQNQDDWMDDEKLAGEGGEEPIELEDVIAAAHAAVRKATNLKEMFEGMDAVSRYEFASSGDPISRTPEV